MSDIQRVIRQLAGRQQQLDAKLNQLIAEDFRTPQEELDALPGRRIFYTLSGRQSFSASQLGLRADPITFTISQDGPFVMTHYPLVMWRPNLPSNATNLGRWSPVASWPLPVQHLSDMDVIDLSYEFFDGGSQRAFNNETAAPIFSRPDELKPLPQQTLFAPNSNIQFFATYEAINFDAGPAVPSTGGELVVSIPGYRIVNS
jgi:hypothetical protein